MFITDRIQRKYWKQIFASVVLSWVIAPVIQIYAQPQDQPEHPFLICTQEQFPELREQSEVEPWASMRENAMQQVEEDFKFDQISGNKARAQELRSFMGAIALTYITEPDKRSDYANRVHEIIVEDLSRVTFKNGGWGDVVATMNAAFLSTIALDIVYNDLSDKQIEDCESIIEKKVNKIDKEGAWIRARLGGHGTWEIYKGLRTSPDDKYYNTFIQQTTKDGVTTTSTHYAWSRLISNRANPVKGGYADVLEFTGVDNRYYNNPRIQRIFEWIAGYSITAAKEMHQFGDTQVESLMMDNTHSPLAYRVGRFGQLAGQYMAWALEGIDDDPPGSILGYVLKKKRFEPKVPTSRLFYHGGAFLCEPKDSPDALEAALYNLPEPGRYHANQETNAVSLSAYGSLLLLNAGRLGGPTRPAELNNTLTINGQEHETRTQGEGLEEGLTSETFDYAAGRSGKALPGDAAFTRNLFLVHTTNEANGYFIIMDQVQTNSSDDTVNQYLHPKTATEPEQVKPKVQYDSDIKFGRFLKPEHNPNIDSFKNIDNTHLSFFYVTEPETVNISLSKSRHPPEAFRDHYRLEALYPVGKKRNIKIATVLFPYKDEHSKAHFKRKTKDGAQGVLISHGNDIRDHFYIGNKAEKVHKLSNRCRFRGEAAFYRSNEQATESYFVRKGTTFRDEEQGFTSDQAISLYMEDTTGRITVNETAKVTFYYPGVSGVRLNNEIPEPVSKADGSVRVELSSVSNQQIKLTFE